MSLFCGLSGLIDNSMVSPLLELLVDLLHCLLFDKLVKSRLFDFSVILAKAGIQYFQ